MVVHSSVERNWYSDNSSNAVLTKRVAFYLEIICRFDPYGSHLFHYVIKTTPSDAESREKQDGSKHKFVGGTMAKIWPDLQQGVAKNSEEK